MLTSPGLLSDVTCVLKAEPGKLDIKRREPGILFIQAIGGCTYATVFSSKKWRTLEDEPHQRENFDR